MQNERLLQEYNLSNDKVIHLVKRPPPARPADSLASEPQRAQEPLPTRTTISSLPNGFGMLTSIQIDASNTDVYIPLSFFVSECLHI